ncbi:MAG: MoxR family ATPase [Aquabacterium sp.]|uniref:AAA family ATPase n=1 Tax=Aquabacterium sp. TaxID=1872578 RepID=UPI00271877D3|nr:MoxR family ATPase [Aquabacterium sp.]MDO9002729.1 MoxR family ATPase [Aquabacterium sp.]
MLLRTEPLPAAAPSAAALKTSQITQLVDQISTIIVGKREQVTLSVICLLAGGHLLIEDVPGVGKTTLSQALARCLGLSFSRIQFTADLLPSDLIGVSVYERQREEFVFHPGPVFAQVLLADEINRAGPRTQSALLEAMEERQVSVEGETRPLPSPFFVIATQNPSEQLGTHPLPESQLDRFAMRLSLGYPDPASERALLMGEDRREAIQHLQPLLSPSEWAAWQAKVNTIHVADALLDYLQALLTATRDGRWFAQGLSPRAGLSLLKLARARALFLGRGHVSPEDIQTLWVPTVAHRLVSLPQSGRSAAAQARALLEATQVP